MKKLITFILSLVLALSCGITVASFATTDNETTALEISGLTAIESFYGAGSANYVFLGEGGPTDWTDQDSSYFVYVDASGQDKLGRVTVYQNSLLINFVYGGTTITAQEGDVVTICKGFTWGSKVLQQDVAFEYNGTEWVTGTPTRYALEVTSLTATDSFYGNGAATYVYLEGFSSNDWVEQDESYFSYVNASGEDILGRVTSWSGHLVINFGSAVAADGDIVTIKQGFIWGNKELKADVSFKYNGTSTAWEAYTAPEPDPEPDPEPEPNPDEPDPTPTAETLALGDAVLGDGNVQILLTNGANQPINGGADLGGGTYGLATTDNSNIANDASKVTITSGTTVYSANFVRYLVDSSSSTYKLQFYFIGTPSMQGVTLNKGDVLQIASDFTLTTADKIYNFGAEGAKYTYDGSKFVAGELVELGDLEIPKFTATSNFNNWGMTANYAFIGVLEGVSGWTPQSNVTYVDKDGNDKLTHAMYIEGYLTVNHQQALPVEGDVITVKQGFVWGDKEAKEDIVFTFTNGLWLSAGMEIDDIAVGNVYQATGNCFNIYLTDNSQQYTTAGWVGGGVTSSFYSIDWNYNFVNDISKVYFVNGANKYEVSDINYFTSTDFRILQVYFKSGCDFALAQKGAMVCFDENFLVNINEDTIYTFGETGTYYYFDGTAWSKASLATDAEITLESSISVGATANVGYTFASGTAAPVLSYSSSSDEVATVSANGVVEGKKEGTATITINFKGFTKTVDIEITKALEPVSLAVEITENIYNDKGALVAYVGEELNKAKIAEIITAKYGFENGTFGSSFAVTADNISLEGYDNSKAGESAITITYNGFTATLKVNVYDILDIAAPSANNVDFWATAIMVNFSSLTADFDNVNWALTGEDLEKLGVADFIEMKAAAKNGGEAYKLHALNYLYSRDIALTFENKGKNDLVAGDVLTFKKGLRIYKRVDTAWIALFELTNDFTVVWSGSDWVNFVAEAESIELSKTEMSLPVGAYQEIEYSILPSGSYITAVITSSNSEAVAISDSGTAIRVLAKSDSPVEITIQLGDDDTTKKVISITTIELEVTGFDIYEEREYNVSLGEELKLEYYYFDEITPRKLYAVAVYSDGSTGEPFALNLDSEKGDVNVVISGYDKEVAGTQNVTLTITKDGKEFDTEIVVKVKDSVAQVSDLLMQDPFGGAPLAFYISFVQTARNEVNIAKDISDAYEIENYIKFVRGDNEYSMEAQFNGQFLVVTPVFPESVEAADRVYTLGDKIILSEGLPILQWMGDSSNYNPLGSSEYVVAGTVEHEIVFVLADTVAKSWDTLIQYEDISLVSDTVEIGIGKLKDLGATMVPAYATVGEFEVVSSDPSIASVNANGLVKGEKIGTATLTITLSGGTNGDIVKTVTVNVVDVITGIKFNKDTIYVDEGTVSINGQLFADKGVEGVFVWASGKEDGVVDFTNAKFVGYSANKEGEQTVTVRVTVNGVSTTGKITVIIGKEPKGGCGSLVGAESAILALVAFAGVAVLKKKK